MKLNHLGVSVSGQPSFISNNGERIVGELSLSNCKDFEIVLSLANISTALRVSFSLSDLLHFVQESDPKLSTISTIFLKGILSKDVVSGSCNWKDLSETERFPYLDKALLRMLVNFPVKECSLQTLYRMAEDLFLESLHSDPWFLVSLDDDVSETEDTYLLKRRDAMERDGDTGVPFTEIVAKAFLKEGNVEKEDVREISVEELSDLDRYKVT